MVIKKQTNFSLLKLACIATRNAAANYDQLIRIKIVFIVDNRRKCFVSFNIYKGFISKTNSL